jgi:hypothetical protein
MLRMYMVRTMSEEGEGRARGEVRMLATSSSFATMSEKTHWLKEIGREQAASAAKQKTLAPCHVRRPMESRGMRQPAPQRSWPDRMRLQPMIQPLRWWQHATGSTCGRSTPRHSGWHRHDPRRHRRWVLPSAVRWLPPVLSAPSSTTAWAQTWPDATRGAETKWVATLP